MTWILVAKNEFKRSLKNKKKLAISFLLPLITIIVAIGINSLMMPSINLGVINNQHKNEEVIREISNIDRIKVAEASKDTINTDMILAKYLGVVEFKGNNEIEVYCLDKSMKIFLEDAILETINTGEANKVKELISILEEGSLTSAQRGNGFIFITFIITATMSASVILKDKEENILLRYQTSPNKIGSYIFGNLMHNIINSILQILASSLFIYLLKLELGIGIGAFIFISTIIAVLSCSIATLMVVLSKSELQANLLSSSIALFMALFGGAFLPVEKMPEALKFISNFSVTKWILELTSFIEKQVDLNQSLAVAGMIMIMSLVMSIISVTLGKRSLLK